MGYWNTVDPALLNGRYFPKPNDFDSAHDYYWQVQDDEKNKLPGMGGVYNAVNLNVYQYGGLNPMVMIDPDGNDVVILLNRDAGFGNGH